MVKYVRVFVANTNDGSIIWPAPMGLLSLPLPAGVVGGASLELPVAVVESVVGGRVCCGVVDWFVSREADAVGALIIDTVGVGSTLKCCPMSLMNSVAVREFVSSIVVKIVSEFIVNGIVCVVVVK